MTATILLVDDSPTILNLLRIALHQEGFKVVTAIDGLEALEQLQKFPVDLVIADVNMPRMDGFTLVKVMRSHENMRDLPVIILSTQSGPRDQRHGLDMGADLYLSKPVTPPDLVNSIRQLLDHKKPEA